MREITMYDRPTAQELLEAARQHIESALLPLAKSQSHKLYFQTLVALNVMKIVERETALRSAHLHAEWSRLNLLGDPQPLPESDEALEQALQTRNQALCAAIRAGDHDTDTALFEHLKATAREQLAVANPKFLQMLAAEDAER